MLVDPPLYKYWVDRYSKPDHELKRYGIMNESDEAVVELALKQINIYPVPNKELFKLSRYQREAETEAL